MSDSPLSPTLSLDSFSDISSNAKHAPPFLVAGAVSEKAHDSALESAQRDEARDTDLPADAVELRQESARDRNSSTRKDTKDCTLSEYPTSLAELGQRSERYFFMADMLTFVASIIVLTYRLR